MNTTFFIAAVQVFHFKVVLTNREHHMFPNEVVLQIFSNIKSIYQFHHDFLLPQLEKRMANWWVLYDVLHAVQGIELFLLNLAVTW
jgi:hypothetical protein